MNPIKHLNNSINSLAEKWGRKTPRSKAGVAGYWLLMQMLVLIPELLLAIPLIIAFVAYGINQSGIAEGDPSGLPASFTLLLAVVALLTLAAVAIIQWWVIAVIKKGRK